MMKKSYLTPTIRAVELDDHPLLDSMSDENIDVPVDPGKPKDPSETLSRDDRGFSLWDEE